ncbi:MAG: TSCPD domain-containing protein, partial [Thermodesulfobacteriota bacterium]|nr:TSCPD domain-containing protein [Thermodesulfobacteriota bacterium]
ASSQIEAAGRLISLALRSGVKIDAIVKQLIGIRCPSPSWQDGKMVLSCPDAIAQVLKKLTNSDFVERKTMLCVCPECGGIMSHEEGCIICRSCGFTKCS